MTMLGAEALLPPLLLLLAMQTVPARALGRTLGNGLVLGGLAVILGRYVHWRWTETLPWGAETSIQTTFVWALFVIEMLTWADAAIFLAQLSRQTDRRAEADAHEARLRARCGGWRGSSSSSSTRISRRRARC